MNEAKWLELITTMHHILDTINGLKTLPQYAEPRGLAIAATHLETAMLWVANSRKDQD